MNVDLDACLCLRWVLCFSRGFFCRTRDNHKSQGSSSWFLFGQVRYSFFSLFFLFSKFHLRHFLTNFTGECKIKNTSWLSGTWKAFLSFTNLSVKYPENFLCAFVMIQNSVLEYKSLGRPTVGFLGVNSFCRLLPRIIWFSYSALC